MSLLQIHACQYNYSNFDSDTDTRGATLENKTGKIQHCQDANGLKYVSQGIDRYILLKLYCINMESNALIAMTFTGTKRTRQYRQKKAYSVQHLL